MNTESRFGRVHFGGRHVAAAWLSLALAVVVVAVTATAQQDPPKVDSVPLVDEMPGLVRPSLVTMSAGQAAKLSPLLQEMREIFISEGLEIALLGARAAYCRTKGLEDEAKRLEGSIAYLEDPRAGSSQFSPAPRSADGKAIRP